MRQAVLRFTAVVAVGLVILAGVLYVATTVDARPPEVTAYRLSQPLPDDETQALTTTSLEVVFSEPVETGSAEAAFDIDPPVDGTFSWSGATMTFTPGERLPLDTEFTVTIGPGVSDPEGNVLEEAGESFTFETVGRPEVVGSTPADGASEVALDEPLVLTFSRLMDTSSVEAALELEPPVPHELRWSEVELEIVPTRPLDPGRRYVVRIAGDATDLAGTPLGEGYAVTFDTVAATLVPAAVLPADGSEGIAVTSPIAIVFDREIDADSLDEVELIVDPAVAGSLELVPPTGALASAEPGGSVLRFVPSAALPPNTTFTLELAAGLEAADGSRLAEPLAWRFTTGAPLPTLGNQIVFLSDRSGTTNLWAMNAEDGTNQRQLSSELSDVVSYAVAPDGRSFVVSDGTRLVRQQADGGGRQVLTEDGFLEFDPAFSPDGRTLAFARADAETGEGLGLWQRGALGGAPERIELPPEVQPIRPTPTAAPDDQEPGLLRAPRYSPDGSAIAFVDPAGRVGIIEMPSLRVTTIAFLAVSPPSWLPNSAGVLLSGIASDAPSAATAAVEPPVLPLDPATVELSAARLSEIEVRRFPRSGTSALPTALEAPAARCTVGVTGRVACIALPGAGDLAGGEPFIAASPNADGTTPATDLVAASVAFAPEDEALLVARLRDAADPASAGIWVVDGDGELTQLTEDGRAPSWLP